MQARRKNLFITIRTEGSILPADLLQRIERGDRELKGLAPEDYHLPGNEKINEAVSRSWTRMLGAWTTFKATIEKATAGDPNTSATRERWLLPLFQELGYGRLLAAKAVEIEGKSYPISHRWQHAPIHLVGSGVDLDTRTAGVAGAAKISPHSLVQEFLNRSEESLWGFVSNGLRLRILRDNVRLTRQAFVEFDLESMMNGEVYSDFVLLWLLCHESRVEAARPEECWLEKWSRTAQEQGTRALEQLRKGVEEAIKVLGGGFLKHRKNQTLKDKLHAQQLSAQDYYRQILRLVYRLLFLFVAEERKGDNHRELLLDPQANERICERYRRFYSVARLRKLAERRVGTRHADLFVALRLVMQKLGSDEGCAELGLPALGSFLFSPVAMPDIEDCELMNVDLLAAVRALTFITDRHGRRLVDYKNLRSEELGSVYEALLELHPYFDTGAGAFELQTASGNERKTTGSYYTPESLVQCLLDSALDPVLDEAAKKENPEAAIRNLKVCDPACGSGHFLIAAAHRIAKRLAAIRTGDEEPAPDALRKALRDVIGECLYGVDVNPMAVELCKVSLWMEALEPGKPLSFLEQHIQVGNSLLGTTPALLEKGIPDDAFKPIEGDDKAVCAKFKKLNKEERLGFQRLFKETTYPWERLGDLATELARLDDIPDDDIKGVRQKEKRYEEFIHSGNYLFTKFWADTWCAAFVWKKTEAFGYPITEDVFRKIERNPYVVERWMRDEIIRLGEQYQFLHWHLAFLNIFRKTKGGEEPENKQAGWSGGFDVVLSNPPWEKIQIEEQLFFSGLDSEIAEASASKRKKLIAELVEKSPGLYREYVSAIRRVAGQTHLLRESAHFPLAGKGNITTHSLFIELAISIAGNSSRIGLVVPSGLATQDSQKELFGIMVSEGRLRRLYDFENSLGLFPSVDSRFKFCLCIIGPPREDTLVEFAFYLPSVDDLKLSDRVFTLSAEALQRVSPNTLSCPTFRNRREAEIYDAVCRNSAILLNTSSGKSPWGWRSWQMFNETHEARELVDAAGVVDQTNLLRHYEAKLFHQFDHRYATFEMVGKSAQVCYTSLDDKRNPSFFSRPRYFISSRLWGERVVKDGYIHNWILAFRKITNSTNERTAIFAILPKCVTGSQTPVAVVNQKPQLIAALLGNLNSFVFDFATRQRVGGTDLNHFIIHQLPVISPISYTFTHSILLQQMIVPRVLELTYTAWDLKPFAEDCGYDGEPFVWNEVRRFLLRCELDAAYFHLYDIKREDVDYILDTFPIVKRKDEQAHGEYRTKRVILEIYEAMQRAMESGEPYQTRLDPPPALGWIPPAIEGETENAASQNDTANKADEFRLRSEALKPQPRLDFEGDD